jgi:deferrochelatase/peroxidase EfeB
MQAHIRKVNPRGRAPDTTLDEEKARRITRRGITYGAHVPDGTPAKDLPVKGLGVLFMCYQANIAAQFGFMQRNWANSASFPQGEIGADALGGQGRRQYHEWPARYGQSARTPFAFQSFITTKGGEFFFAPSRPFFDRP